MSRERLYVGLDVAKATLDVAVRPRGDRWSVAHDEPAVAGLVERLRGLRPALIVCQATGGFERAPAGCKALVRLPLLVVARLCYIEHVAKNATRRQRWFVK